MLENAVLIPTHVEFVAYTGRWPNLCGGMLTLKFDGGDEIRFGNNPGCRYPAFWRSGGRCPSDDAEPLEYGPWIVDVDELPEKYRPYAYEIDRLMNENIEPGCCGGCR